MGKNLKINSSTDWNKAETVGKISKINSSTGTLIQHLRVLLLPFTTAIDPFMPNCVYTDIFL